MDWQQYKAWIHQMTGPCGHNIECPPKPVGHCNPPPQNFCPPPPPPCPPAPPVPGDSPMECMNNLYAQVCAAMKQCGELNANTQHLLNDLHTYGLKNGAYYDDSIVNVTEGYNADDSSPFTIIQIQPFDSYGNPVTINLHLAYGNTTNSGIKEKITDASLYELAQVIVPALNDGNSWTGYVTYQGAPLPSNNDVPKFTYGFTKNGVLKVYNDTFISANPNILVRDTIVTSMGCEGPIIRDGQVTTGDDIQYITNYTTKSGRVLLGYNSVNKTTLIMIVGGWGENYPGMTVSNCVSVLMGYGCTTAVQLASGSSACGLNEGAEIVPPSDNVIQSNLAFLYVSKKSFFKNEIQFSLAYLTQLMNQLKFSSDLSDEQITNILNQIAQETEARENAVYTLTAQLTAETVNRENADNAITETINKEIENRENAVNEINTEISIIKEKEQSDVDNLQTNINSEVNRALKAEEFLQENINTEVNRATSVEDSMKQTIQALEDKITSDINNSLGKINQIQTDLQNEITRSTTFDDNTTTQLNTINTNLTELSNNFDSFKIQYEAQIKSFNDQFTTVNTNVDNLLQSYADFQKQLIAFDTALTKMLGNINNIETSMNEIKALIADLETVPGQVTDLTNQVNTMQTTVDDLDKKLEDITIPEDLVNDVNKLKTDVETIDETLSNIQSNITSIDNNIQTIQQRLDSLEDEIKNYLPLTGGTLSGTINMDQNKVTGLPTPTENTDATNKKYVDDAVAAGGSSEEIETLENDVVGIKGDITDIQSGLNSLQSDLSKKLSLSGGTMTGNIDMGTGKITNLAIPINTTDAATKQYVDSKINSGSFEEINYNNVSNYSQCVAQGLYNISVYNGTGTLINENISGVIPFLKINDYNFEGILHYVTYDAAGTLYFSGTITVLATVTSNGVTFTGKDRSSSGWLNNSQRVKYSNSTTGSYSFRFTSNSLVLKGV